MIKKYLLYSSFILVFLAVLVFSYENPQRPDYSKYPDVSSKPISFSTVEENGLWTVVNDWKEKESGYRYTSDERLCEQASIRANQIKSDWSHNGFDEVPFFDFKTVGENLAAESNSNNDILTLWLTSPTHKENLDENFTHSCIRCEDNYCVQLFGKY